MLQISVRADIKKLEKTLNDLAYKQMPFATAQALTALGKQVKDSEKAALPSIFDKPTPFTQNAIGVTPARKDNPQAVVFMKDITAAYLEPYQFGGKNKLNSKALLKPVDLPVNQYGNLPRNKLAQLKAKPNVFVGKVKGKGGQEIEGVWQRVPAARGKPASLKLLIKFADAHDAKEHIDWFTRADGIVRRGFNREFGRAMAKAIATAK